MEVKIDSADVKKIVDTHIALAVAEALSKDTEGLIKEFVHIAVNQKSADHYGKTVLQKALEDMLVEEIKQAIKRWLDINRAKLQDALDEKLRKDKSLAKRLVDSIIDGTAGDFQTHFHVIFPDGSCC